MIHAKPRAIPAYPFARRSSAVRTFHGHAIADPYDWLGGPETAEISGWQRAQEDLTDRFVGGETCDHLASWLNDLLSRPHSFRVCERGKRLFFLRDEPGRDQPALFVADGDAPPRLMFDPATLSEGDCAIVQQSIAVAPDGKHVALAVATQGNDAHSIILIETLTGCVVDGSSPRTIVPTIEWRRESDGFFYNRNQSVFVPDDERMATPEGVYWHRVGTRFDDDGLVCGKAWTPAHVTLPALSFDGASLFVSDIHLTRRCGALALHDLRIDSAGPQVELTRPLLAGDEGIALYLGDDGVESFFVMEFGDTQRGEVVAIDRRKPARAQWRTVLDEPGDAIAGTSHDLRSCNAIVFDGRLYLTQIRDAHHRLAIYDLSGGHVRDVRLPAICSMAGPGGERYGEVSVAGDGVSLLFEVWTHTHRQLPLRYDPKLDAVNWLFSDEVDEAALRTRVSQVFFDAADGTRIPAFVLDATEAQGAKPTLLYGYGGFGASITPEFSPDIPAWLRLGGRYVIANIRGGGEYGKAWHEAGRARNRQTVFDDFCAVAAALVDRGYASRETLAIRGISNGGLLTGACVVQRPELFGAVVCELPLLDGLALGFDAWGEALAPEYGNPVADERDFVAILKWSPLQNVHARPYPPIFVVAAEKDAAVLVDGVRKFVAALQAASPNTLTLFRLVPGCGHTGWPRSATVRMIAEEIVFLAEALGVDIDWTAFESAKRRAR
jgi:prolyl oligopeptidase